MSEKTETEQPTPTEKQQQREPTDSHLADKYFNRFRKFFFGLGILAILGGVGLILMVSAGYGGVEMIYTIIGIPVIIAIYFGLWAGLRRESALAWKAAMGFLVLIFVFGATNPGPGLAIPIVGLYWGWKAKDATVL